MSRHLRVINLVLIGIAVCLFLYWAKCQYQIDIFKNIQWERYLPLNFLQRKEPIVDAKKHEMLIEEDFDHGSLSHWSKLWSRVDAGSIEMIKDEQNSSNYVSINNPVEAEWSFQRGELVQVSPGQTFEYHASYRANTLSYMGIILYNSRSELVDWFYAKSDLPATSVWKNVGRSFVIPSGTAYMRFRVFGSNKGFLSLDHIVFKKGVEL